jgi:beta-phosphoglucomutase
MAVRAIFFDFNGTLSDDEPVLCSIYQELFAEHGRPLPEACYYSELAGHSDEEIVLRWLGRDFEPLEQVVAARIDRFRERVADGSSITAETRDAVRYAAERVPVAVVSGAARREIEPVLAAAGLADVLGSIVAANDVADGKPHPESYLRALELVGSLSPPANAVAFEDTEAGVASAKDAGVTCVALTRTLPRSRLSRADSFVEQLDLAAVRTVLA